VITSGHIQRDILNFLNFTFYFYERNVSFPFPVEETVFLNRESLVTLSKAARVSTPSLVVSSRSLLGGFVHRFNNLPFDTCGEEISEDLDQGVSE